MLNYMIIFKECFKTAQLIRFKVYSFVTPFPNIEVPGWGVTKATEDDESIEEIDEEMELRTILIVTFHISLECSTISLTLPDFFKSK